MKLFGKSTEAPVTVETIHQVFFTEVDRLLEEAKTMRSTEFKDEKLIEKGSKLAQLGFTNSKDVKLAMEEHRKVDEIETENRRKRVMTKAIEYFGVKYPQYKFITEESVKKICQKYSLIYGEVRHYIGIVPDKNVDRILEFKVADDDKLYNGYFNTDRRTKIDSGYGSKQHYSSVKARYENGLLPNYITYYEEAPLEICAPVTDFNTKDMEVKDFKLTEKPKVMDPVVLQPVYFGGAKYYLIVTAWGDEASDESVVNEKMN